MSQLLFIRKTVLAKGNHQFAQACGLVIVIAHVCSDGYGQRSNVRKAVAADPRWPEASAPVISHFESQDNLSMRLFSWSSVKKDVSPGGKTCYS